MNRLKYDYESEGTPIRHPAIPTRSAGHFRGQYLKKVDNYQFLAPWSERLVVRKLRTRELEY